MVTPNYLYPNLQAEMARKKLNTQHIAEGVGVKFDTIYRKLTGQIRWYEEDMKKVRDIFFPNLTLDYLFDTEPSLPQKRQKSK